jgi:hypothetical protein
MGDIDEGRRHVRAFRLAALMPAAWVALPDRAEGVEMVAGLP